MNELQHPTYQAIRAIVKRDFETRLEKDVQGYADFLTDIEHLLVKYRRAVSVMEEEGAAIGWAVETLSLKQNIFEKLNGLRRRLHSNDLDTEFVDFFKSIDHYLQIFEEELIVRQTAERFKVSTEEKFPIRGLKVVKYLIFRASTWPNGFVNLFRKEKKVVPYWKHKVPLHRLAGIHLRDELALNLIGLDADLYHLLGQFLIRLESIADNTDSGLALELANEDDEPDKMGVYWWETPLKYKKDAPTEDENQVFIEMRTQLQAFRESIPQMVEGVCQTAFDKYQDNFEKVGTIELFSSRYRGRNLLFWKKLIRKNYQMHEGKWMASTNALIDSWLFRLEIKVLHYLAIKEYLRIERVYSSRINSLIDKELEKIKLFVEETKKNIQGFEGQKEEELRQFIRAEKRKVKTILTNKMIDQTVNSISNQDLPRLIYQIELSVCQQAEKLPQQRFLTRNAGDQLPITERVKELVYPTQLVYFEAIPKFRNSIKSIRSGIFHELHNIQEFIKEINQIIEFALESSLAAFEEDYNKEMDAKKIAEEGIERAMLKMEDVYSELHLLYRPVSTNLKASVREFSTAIVNLLNASGLSKLRGRIATAQAMRPTQLLKKRLQYLWVSGIPALSLLLGTKWKELRTSYKELKIRLGLETAPDTIATEIADYYAESKAAVAKLPYVYQRLFTLGPATDESLVVERPKEEAKLLRAWENWQKGTFAPVCIISERGAGITTLINIFLAKHCKATQATRMDVRELIRNEEEFMSFIKQGMQKDDIQDVRGLIDYFNGLERKRIVVLEDIQFLFLKKVNGFSLLKLLFEIISKTNNKVFWITSCTLYAWSYLQKTIDVSDYLAYEIYIGSLTNEVVVESILKRHRISGYHVQYLPSSKIAANHRYKKLLPKEQQKYLENEYFTRLCNFAQSNLSLAIVYWLRSTRKVEGNTITIGLQENSFSFLASLSYKKLFNLYEIILYGGLAAKDLGIIRNITENQAEIELLLLFDDGIIFYTKGQFELNLLLYRPIIRLLKAKNIIH